MKRTILITLICVLLLPAATFAESSNAMVSAAPTAAAQIARAQQLLQQLQQAPPAQKFELFAQAWGNLAIVRKRWPNDKNAVVRSGIMQADLAAEFGAWSKTIEPLTEILPAAAKTDSEAQVEQKLGQAYERTGNAAEAETHLLAAERALHSAHAGRVQAESVLSTVAMFYARQNKPQEAIQRFRAAANLPGQSAINKTHFQLNVADQAARLGRDAAAPELTRFDDLVLAARSTSLTPADATLLDHMVQHAQRLRNPAPKH